MRRFLCLLIVIGATALITGVAAGHPHGSRGVRVALRQTAVGTILVTGRGFTLYAFSLDGRNHDRCAGISGCAAVWPLLKAGGTPIAGRGVKASQLGTIKLAHGVRQVTYAGHPLYTYVGDAGPGSTGYVGADQFGGAWSALSAAGRLIR